MQILITTLTVLAILAFAFGAASVISWALMASLADSFDDRD